MTEKDQCERQIDELKAALAAILATRRAPLTADEFRQIVATLRPGFNLVADADTEQLARWAESIHDVSLPGGATPASTGKQG